MTMSLEKQTIIMACELRETTSNPNSSNNTHRKAIIVNQTPEIYSSQGQVPMGINHT